MSLSNDELEQRIDVLNRRLALLPTTSQIASLLALVNSNNVTITALITTMQGSLDTLKAEVADLSSRVLSLESA